MAKIPQGILGGISGKIGGIVGSSWKGINVIKTKPLSVANPKTAGQVAQRNLFGNTVAFAVVILATIIKPLWDRFASRQSGFNAFIQANIAYFVDEMPVFNTGFAISKGKMAKTDLSIQTRSLASGVYAIEWLDDTGSGYKLATDEIYLVCVNISKGLVSSSSAAAVRSDLAAEIDFPAGTELADILNLFWAFKRADGTIVSNSGNHQGDVAA